jgi:hypothetical protein
MTYSFSDPKAEKDLAWIAGATRDSKIAILRRLIGAEKKRLRRKSKDE